VEFESSAGGAGRFAAGSRFLVERKPPPPAELNLPNVTLIVDPLRSSIAAMLAEHDRFIQPDRLAWIGEPQAADAAGPRRPAALHRGPPQLAELGRQIAEYDCAVAGHERYSISSSARVSSDRGTSRPSTFAALRLMTSSIFSDCWNGRSAGLAPLRKS
jgi:hypothetical protein